jgi:hypothetical protein
MSTIYNSHSIMVPLPSAPAVFGLSRSALYRLAAAGQVRMVKVASRTLVDATSVREYLASLPTVCVRNDPWRQNCASKNVGA